jgi:hypothetical protein
MPRDPLPFIRDENLQVRDPDLPRKRPLFTARVPLPLETLACVTGAVRDDDDLAKLDRILAIAETRAQRIYGRGLSLSGECATGGILNDLQQARETIATARQEIADSLADADAREGGDWS